MITDISLFLSLWLPWFSFLNLNFFLQISILYTFFLIYKNINLYNVLFYVFLQIIFFGFFLSLYSLEIFAAFLWLTEIVIILVSLFVLFSTNPTGFFKKNNTEFNYFNKNIIIIFLSLIPSILYTSFYLSEDFFYNNIINIYLWDNYYEALFNENTNDLYGLFLSFYWLNSVEYIIIGLLLLFGSLACVQLNRFFKDNKVIKYSDFFTLFDFFKDLSKNIFMRKQNLVEQLNSVSSTRIFKKKNKK